MENVSKGAKISRGIFLRQKSGHYKRKERTKKKPNQGHLQNILEGNKVNEQGFGKHVLCSLF